MKLAWSVLCCSWAVTACASAAITVDRGAALLSERPAPREGCRIDFASAPLPALAQIADSSALAANVYTISKKYQMSTEKLFAVFTVQFDDKGLVSKVQAIDYFLPPGEPEVLTGFVRRAAKTQEHGPRSVRVRIEPTAQKVFRIGYSEICPPQSLTRYELQVPVSMLGGRVPNVRLRMLVREDGTAYSMELQASTGSDELDRWVTSNLETRKFLPGLIDGILTTVVQRETVAIKQR